MSDNDNSGCGCIIGPGGIAAIVLSYALNGSFGWAVLHGMFGWLYVAYVVLVRNKEILPAIQRWFS